MYPPFGIGCLPERILLCTIKKYSRCLKRKQDCYICGNYKKRTHDCTAHFIRTDLLTAGVLSNLRKVTSYAAKHEARFMKLLIEQNEDGGKRRNAAKKKELEAADKVDEFRKKSLRDLRTELNSAVGYAELCRRHGSLAESYLNKLSIVHSNMEKTISFALGEAFDDKTDIVDTAKIDELQGNRLLLVDDNELNREILKEVLLDHGLLIEETDNGSKALTAVKEHEPGYYRFILMDIEMPEMDGYDATLKIRKLPNRIRANTPIIALTANAVPENQERAFAVGMDDFLVKPVNIPRLLSCLVKLL